MRFHAQPVITRSSRRICSRWPAVFAVLTVVYPFIDMSALPARAEVPEPEGRRQAVLIGIGQYQRAMPLRYTANDVRQLALTLRERGDYSVLEIIDTARESERQSEREAIQAKVEACLAKLGPHDDALVYFSGHGFRDNEGQLYLALVDCNPTDPAPGSIPVAWLREQLAGCKAKFKLLIIDACHAGSEKGGEQVVSVAAKDLGMPFRDLASVVTLASSQSDEKSLIWHEKRQSLFSYWLNRGLKGHADQNGNGEISIDELFQYVFQNVTDVAERHFKCKQTPARIIRSGPWGVPVVISLNPQTLKGLLDDMAEELATAMQLRGLSKVGVPEFTVDMGPRELLGGQFGTLGRYCAVELERCLTQRSAGKFSVIEHDALREVLAQKSFPVRALHTRAISEISVKGEKPAALALGTLRNRAGRLVTIQCKLVGLEDQRNYGTAGGPAALSESELAMMRASVWIPERLGSSVEAPEPPELAAVFEQAEKRPHPLLDPKFPYRVQVMVGEQEREGLFVGKHANDLVVPLREGEVYWLRIENRTDGLVLMRLLVDGRSTLPEEPAGKAVTVEGTGSQPHKLPAQTVNLAEAHHWRLPGNRTFMIRGFFKEVGQAGAYHEFQVANAPDSFEAREDFGDELGVITVAFYHPKSRGRGRLMTKPGKERRQRLRMYKDTGVGRLIASYKIHYVTPEAFEKLKKEQLLPAPD